MNNEVVKISTLDVAKANLWLGYVQGVADEKGQPLELVIPLGRNLLKEVSISVVHDSMGNFMTSPQSAEATIPIEKLQLNHKFMPVNPTEGQNTLIYLSAETSDSLTVKFNELNSNYYTSGKVAWR